MNIQTELKRIGTELSKATDVRAVELNPTMPAATAEKLIRDVVDHAKIRARSQAVTLVSFGHRK